MAAVGTVNGSAPFTVGPPVPVGLGISPSAGLSVIAGASQPTKASAILTFSDKSTQDVSSQVVWSETNSFVASVDSSGNITGLHNGYTKLTATASNFSATVDLVIIQQPRYLYVNTNAGRIISRATIDPNTGQLRMAGNVITGANNLAFTCLSTDPGHQFLYAAAVTAAIPNSGEVLIYSIDQNTGALTAVVGSPFATSAPVGCIEFERTGKFGYANGGTDGINQLFAFSRDANTGILTQIGTVSLNGTAAGVAIDPLGQYVYTATFALSNTAQAYGFSIDPGTGALTPVTGTPFALSNATGVFSFHPTGNFLYMANTNGASIDTYSVNRSTGAVALAASLPTCINPTAVRFVGKGQFAYSACSQGANHNPNDSSVETFSVGANGALAHVNSAPSVTGAFDLTPDPSGQFLYLSANTSYVYAFNIDANGVANFARRIGVLSNQSSTMAVVGGGAPVRYTTKFAYVSSTGDNHLTTFPVNADGTFGASPGPATSTQTSPFSLASLPWGSNLLVASTAAKPNLMGYPLSAATGLPGAGFNFGDAVTSGSVAIDTTEQWGFESDSTNGVIFTYENIGGSWFLLSYLTGSGTVTSFPAGAGAGPMMVDPVGRFLYVANRGAKSISAYDYAGTSPELLEATGNSVLPFTDGSPFSVSAQPLALAMDPGGAFLYVIASDQTLQVYGVDYVSGGHLAHLTTASLAGPPAGVAAEPTGRFVYAADSLGVKAFSVDKSGSLTAITLSSAISLSNISGIFVEPSGKFLYVLTSTTGTGAVLVFTINNDGTLTAVSGTPVATPNQPSSMTFSTDIR
jgi:6-phosphogluconolactonase (cycloisomerase 2 family)